MSGLGWESKMELGLEEEKVARSEWLKEVEKALELASLWGQA
jgi:hypothetical protein